MQTFSQLGVVATTQLWLHAATVLAWQRLCLAARDPASEDGVLHDLGGRSDARLRDLRMCGTLGDAAGQAALEEIEIERGGQLEAHEILGEYATGSRPGESGKSLEIARDGSSVAGDGGPCAVATSLARVSA